MKKQQAIPEELKTPNPKTEENIQNLPNSICDREIPATLTNLVQNEAMPDPREALESYLKHFEKHGR